MAIGHKALVNAVAKRAGRDDLDRVERETESVLAGVARRVGPDGRARLAGLLPRGFAKIVTESTTPVEDPGLASFLATVSSVPGDDPERARYVAQAVLSFVAEMDPAVAETLRAELPDEFGDLFTRPPARSGEATASPTPPTPPTRLDSAAPPVLTREEVEGALEELPGWTGDEHRIRRTVSLPAEVADDVRERIARVEEQLNHHAVVEEDQDGTTYLLWTHSRGGVTELDIELAARISDIVDNV
ncbi:4a-hydroxytetrahydrobiopterin dehydratase [Nocardioides aquiterrae]|uniref:Putative pterin-4-alpha-carbinolamine dehydratase n=1 Tax=Nocardioides aquiterrae TaxID=203799 RepID=A0ABN1U9D8_9ACTN